MNKEVCDGCEEDDDSLVECPICNNYDEKWCGNCYGEHLCENHEEELPEIVTFWADNKETIKELENAKNNKKKSKD